MGGERDEKGSKIGMWLFLLSEILFFGALFVLYGTYRYKHPLDFHLASADLNRILGALHTLILITSSLTMAISITALRKRDRMISLLALAATLLLGLLFLVNKGLEWSVKFGHELYPNAPRLLSRPKGEVLFYGLYYSITGLHALHVLVGVVLISIVAFLVVKKRIDEKKMASLENVGLYWHLVDIIWIFIFPLFYLIP